MDSKTSGRHRVFVYGTLKQGFCRHAALASEKFLGTARTQPCYRMVNIGEYPGLFAVEENGVSILGEIWEVSPSVLKRLDGIEGTDEGEYVRKEIQLLDPRFGFIEAYFFLGGVDRFPDCGESWDVR